MAALVEGVWPKDFQEEVARDMEFKGLQAHPDESFTLMKNMTERQKIAEEEKSKQKRERSDEEKANANSSGPLHRLGCTWGLDRDCQTGVREEYLKHWSVAGVADEDIVGESALLTLG